MTRKVPDCPTRPEHVRPWNGYEDRPYSIQIVTPMFGGGVEPGEPDPVTLIRPSAIRGHLRFWWRATRGAACTDTKDLKRREVEIFGDTENPSPVIVEVRVTSKGTKKPCAILPPGKTFPKFADDHPGYALFPFQGNVRKGIPIRSGTNGATFDLRVVSPSKLRDDVNAALWAWVNFGGIGSRSRRGCGTLYCADFAPSANGSLSDIDAWFHAKTSEYGLGPNPVAKPWPLLGGQLVVGGTRQPPMKAWSEIVSLLRTFRQGDGVGRNPGSGKPKRSRWPEPESIRRATKKRLGKHARLEEITDDAYPRAEFGLPIIFQFKDANDPPLTQLVPANGEFARMASPLILKPLAVSADVAVSAIVPLLTFSIDSVSLEQVDPPRHIETKAVRNPRASEYRNSPLGPPAPNTPPRSESGSAIEAFIQFACERGFERIGREVTS